MSIPYINPIEPIVPIIPDYDDEEPTDAWSW